MLLGTGVDLGDLGSSVEILKYKNMRHSNTLTWPENVENPPSQNLSFEKFPPHYVGQPSVALISYSLVKNAVSVTQGSISVICRKFVKINYSSAKFRYTVIFLSFSD